LIRPLIVRSLGLARLQHFLDCFDAAGREEWIADFERTQTITHEEAALLREHNEAHA
jgi:hypothetical protein